MKRSKNRIFQIHSSNHSSLISALLAGLVTVAIHYASDVVNEIKEIAICIQIQSAELFGSKIFNCVGVEETSGFEKVRPTEFIISKKLLPVKR